MQFGMVGLGRMGAGMVRRLMRGGHTCVVYDRSPQAVDALVKDGAMGSTSPADFAKRLDRPRTACLMVPAATSRARPGARSWAAPRRAVISTAARAVPDTSSR